MGMGWYVVRVLARMESVATTELRRDGYEIYCPRFNASSMAAGAPMFPGYLFLRWDPEINGWPTFRVVHKVIGWLRFGGIPPCVPDDVISTIINQSEIYDDALWSGFKPGQRAFLSSNGIESLVEILETSKSPQCKSRVLLSFMGRIVEASVPWRDLKPAENSLGEQRKLVRRTRGRGRRIRAHSLA